LFDTEDGGIIFLRQVAFTSWNCVTLCL